MALGTRLLTYSSSVDSSFLIFIISAYLQQIYRFNSSWGSYLATFKDRLSLSLPSEVDSTENDLDSILGIEFTGSFSK